MHCFYLYLLHSVSVLLYFLWGRKGSFGSALDFAGTYLHEWFLTGCVPNRYLCALYLFLWRAYYLTCFNFIKAYTRGNGHTWCVNGMQRAIIIKYPLRKKQEKDFGEWVPCLEETVSHSTLGCWPAGKTSNDAMNREGWP